MLVLFICRKFVKMCYSYKCDFESHIVLVRNYVFGDVCYKNNASSGHMHFRVFSFVYHFLISLLLRRAVRRGFKHNVSCTCHTAKQMFVKNKCCHSRNKKNKLSGPT